jgi:hypothetical protein
MCLSLKSNSVGKGSPVRSGTRAALVEHLDADVDMADELPFVGVAEDAVEAELADLADVVQENAHEQQVAVDFGIEGRQPVDPLQEGDDVFEEPAQIGVVVANAGRDIAESIHEAGIHEEAFCQGPEVRVFQA